MRIKIAYAFCNNDLFCNTQDCEEKNKFTALIRINLHFQIRLDFYFISFFILK